MELKTPLYETHLRYSGKVVPFAGYLLPIQYSGITAEHMAVRTRAGLFDVSHMGEVTLTGKDALKNLQMLVTNDCEPMVDGQIKYSPMCNDEGGVVDDLLVYRRAENDYYIVINAANHDKDVAWIKERISGDVKFEDISSDVAQLALQGPESKNIILKLCDADALPQKYYYFKDNVSVGGINCLVSRTGYTGEFGYELYCANDDASELWEKIMAAGEEYGIIPCGLGARDTLRMEASMPLYGHEMDDTITPIEAGIDFFVKLDKPDFIGKSAIIKKGEPARTRIGLELTDRGIMRENCDVYANGEKIGVTTSGTMCPFVKKAIAMALVGTNRVVVGDSVEVDVRGRRLNAKVVDLPFYKRTK